jgi:hypothetical protein
MGLDTETDSQSERGFDFVHKCHTSCPVVDVAETLEACILSGGGGLVRISIRESAVRTGILWFPWSLQANA